MQFYKLRRIWIEILFYLVEITDHYIRGINCLILYWKKLQISDMSYDILFAVLPQKRSSLLQFYPISTSDNNSCIKILIITIYMTESSECKTLI